MTCGIGWLQLIDFIDLKRFCVPQVFLTRGFGITYRCRRGFCGAQWLPSSQMDSPIAEIRSVRREYQDVVRGHKSPAHLCFSPRGSIRQDAIQASDLLEENLSNQAIVQTFSFSH